MGRTAEFFADAKYKLSGSKENHWKILWIEDLTRTPEDRRKYYHRSGDIIHQGTPYAARDKFKPVKVILEELFNHEKRKLHRYKAEMKGLVKLPVHDVAGAGGTVWEALDNLEANVNTVIDFQRGQQAATCTATPDRFRVSSNEVAE